MVCMLDPAMAAQRDQATAAGAPPLPIAPPKAGPGVFAEGEPGTYVACAAEAMGGGGFELLTLSGEAPDLTEGFGHRRVSADSPEGRWLAGTGAPAALLRPDGYVFGLGEGAALIEGLKAALGAAV
jgi:hypothetical protein